MAMVLSVLVLVVLPLLFLEGVRYFLRGRRHHSSLCFEMWVDWRTWRMQIRK